MYNFNYASIAKEVKDNIKDEQILTSQPYLHYLQKVARNTTGNYELLVKYDLQSDTAYTNGDRIGINPILSIFSHFSLTVKTLINLGFTAHEIFHIIYTDFKEFKKLIDRRGDFKFFDILKNIFNSIEDGAVELQGTNYFIGDFKKAIIFLNMCLYEVSPNVEDGKTKTEQILNCIINYSTIGKVKGDLSKSKVEALFNKIKRLIEKGRYAKTTKDRIDISIQIYEKLLPTIEKDCKRSQPQLPQNKTDNFKSSRDSQPSSSSSTQIKQDFHQQMNEKKDEKKEEQEAKPNNTAPQNQSDNADNKDDNSQNNGSDNKKSDNSQEQNKSNEGNSAAEDNKDKKEGEGSSSSSKESEDNSSDNKKSSSSNDDKSEKGQENNKGEKGSPSNSNEKSDTESSSKGEGKENKDNNPSDNNKSSDTQNGNSTDKNNTNSDDKSKDTSDKENGTPSNDSSQPNKDVESEFEKFKRELSEKLDSISEELKNVTEEASKEVADNKVVDYKQNETQQLSDDIDFGLLHRFIDKRTHFYKAPVLTDEISGAYNYLFAPVKSIAKNIAMALEKILKFQDDSAMKGQRVGSFCTSQAHRIFSDGKIFQRQKEKDLIDVAFEILIDCSGSMKDNNRIVYAKMACIVMEEVCRKLHVPLSIIGHRAMGGQARVEHYHVLDFDSPEKFKYNILHLEAGGNTREGVSLKYAGEYMLKHRKEENKVLLVISDGEPTHMDYHGSKAQVDVSQIVADLEKKKVKVIGINIGGDAVNLSKFYKTAINIGNVSQLPNCLLNILKKYFK